MLSDKQAGFIQSLLPHEQASRNPHAFVWLGIGPPGSGKTVVAVDAAQEARHPPEGHLALDVLVLVPSSNLLTTYKRELGRVTAVEEGRFADAADDAQDHESRVWVERVGPFFDALANPESQEHPVDRWWDKVLELPAIHRWKTKNPCVTTTRFRQLIDAVLFDDSAGGEAEKSALAEQDAHLRAAMAELEGGVREAVESLKAEHKVLLRWERARMAVAKLAEARPGRGLLILVDEAQDLIPAQWQALAHGAYRRRAKDITRLALLGDENQRITPTAFAWTDVKGFVGGLHPDLSEGIGVETTELPGSFRIPRAVAHVANPLVDGRLGTGKRLAAVVDPTTIAEEGVVEIVVVADPHAALAEAAAEVASGNDDPDALLIVLTEEEFEGGGIVDSVNVVQAKGIEWNAVVVAGLFTGSADFDGRARAYTRLTRARQRVVLLVSAADCEFMWEHWKQHIEAEGGGVRVVERRELASALQKCLDTEGPEIRAEKLLSRIGQALDQAERDGGGFPTVATDLVTRIILLGGAAEVPDRFCLALAQNPAWEEELRAAGRQGGAGSRVASVLAVGDVGEALALAERLPELATWVEPLTNAVDESGPLARASAELWRQAEADATLETLVVTAFRHHVADALARPELGDPPTSTPLDGMPPRVVLRVKQAIEAACRELTEEADQFESVAGDRVRAEMGRVEQWVDASVVCRDLRAVEARLQRLEELVGTTEVSQ